MAEFLSEEWAKAWGEALATSEEYRKAAQRWEGPVLFRLKGSDRAVYLDLWHGECRDARAATDSDPETARFILSADLPTWLSVLDGTIAPLPAVMRGRLKLEKGKLSSLMPYTAAARELVQAATCLDTRFPDDIQPQENAP